MKIRVKNRNFKFVSNNSKECDKDTAFLKTSFNESYLDDIDTDVSVIDCSYLKNLLDISKIKIIAITGTNGKTSVSTLISYILNKLGIKTALQGTRGFFISDKILKGKFLTTPDILEIYHNLSLAKEYNCEFFVMELSSHAISQNRTEGLDFYLKIFTNISSDHLDYHKNIEEYRKVKNSFFDDESLKLINIDDKWVKFNKKNSYTYGINNKAYFMIKNYSLNKLLSAKFCFHKNEFSFSSKLMGFFNFYNILASVSAITLLVNENIKDILKHLSDFEGISGRMEIISHFPLVIVDFAHTEDGMFNVLNSLKHKNIILVFGAGGDRDKDKRAKMGKLATLYAKTIYITSDNPRNEDPNSIIDDIMLGVQREVFKEVDRKKAIYRALQDAKDANDVVLILGKGDEDYQIFKNKKIFFSDKDIVQDFLKNK